MFRTEKHGSIRCENGEIESKGTQGIYNAVGSNGNSRITSNSDNFRQHQCKCDNEVNTSEGREYALNDFNENVGQKNATNTKNIGQEYALEDGELERRRFGKSYKRNIWDSFPSQSPICGGNDGICPQLDGITFSKWRQESIKGYGNAIVPQVAYEIFKVINQMHYDTIPQQTKRGTLISCD